MTDKNIAALLPSKGSQIEMREVEKWTPGPGEILIKNVTVATNPLDFIIQMTGEIFAPISDIQILKIP